MFLKFIEKNTGTVAIEFALVVPVIAIMFLGTTELTQYIWANGDAIRLSKAVNSVVSSSDNLTDDSLESLLTGATHMLDTQAINSSMDITITSVLFCSCPESSTNTDNQGNEPCLFTLWTRRSNIKDDGEVVFTESPHQSGEKFQSTMMNISYTDNEMVPEKNFVVTEVIYAYRPLLTAIMQKDAFELTEGNIDVVRYNTRLEMKDEDTNESVCADFLQET